MNQSTSDRRQSGNVKPLIAISLAVIATLYLTTGTLPSATEERSATTVSTADRDAVARTLAPGADWPLAVERLTVIAPRITLPELELETPVVEVAVVATPPSVERDPS